MDLITSRLDVFLPPRVTLQPYLPSNDGTNQLAESANDVLLAARPIPIFQVIRPALRTLDQVIFNLRGGNTHPALDKAPSPATAPMGGRLYLLQGAPSCSVVVAQEPTSHNGLRARRLLCACGLRSPGLVHRVSAFAKRAQGSA